ncbi:hypothetical protein AAHC03_013700 [Spirometra sp. Aus1]
MAASLTSPQAGDLPASCLHTLHYDSIIADACAYNRRLFKGRESRPPFFDIATQITQRPAPWLQRNSQGGLKRLSTSRSQFVLVYRRHRWRLQPRRPTSKQQTRLVDGIALDSSQLLLMFPPVSFSGNQSKSGASESTPGGRCAPKNQPLPPEPVKQPSTAILYDPEASLHGSASGDGSCLSSATQNSTSNSASSFMDRRFVGDQAFAGSKLLTDSGFVASRRTDYRCQDQQQQPSFDEQQQRFRTYPSSSTGGDPSQQAVSGASYYLNGDKMRLRGEQGTNTTAAITRPTTGYDSGKAKMGKKRALGDRTGQKPCTKSTGDFGQAQVGRREPRSKTDNRRYDEGNRHGLALDSETLDNDSQDSCALSEEATYRSNALLPPRPPPLPPPGSPPQGSPSGLLQTNMERGLAAYGSRDPRGGSLAQPPRFSEGILGSQPRMSTADNGVEMSPSRSDNSSLDGLRWRSNSEDCNPSFQKANVKTPVTPGSGIPSVSLENTPCMFSADTRSMFNESNASPVSSGGRSAPSNHPCGLTYSPSPRSSVGVSGAPVPPQMTPQKLTYGKRTPGKVTMPTGATPTSPPSVPPPGILGNSCIPGGPQQQQEQQTSGIDGQASQADSSATTMVTFFVCEVCASRYRSTAGLRYHYHSQHAGYTPRNPISASASRITIPMHEYNRYGPATGLRGGRNSRSKRNRCNNNYVCHRTAASSSQKSRAPPMNGGLDSQRGSSEVSGLRGPSESDLYQMPSDATPEDHRPRSLYSGGSSVAERSASDSSSFLSSLKLSTSSDLDYTRRQSPSFSHSPLTAVAPETQMKQPFSGQHFSALPDTSVSSCSSSSSCSALASMDHMASSLLQQQQQSQSSGLLTQLQSANFAKNARSGSPKEQHIGRAFTDSLSVLGTTTSASYAADTFKLMQPSKPERGVQQLGGTSPLCAQMPPEGSAVTQYQSSMPSFLADYYMTPDAFSGGGGGGVPMCHQRPPPTYGPGAAVGRSSFLEFRNMMRQRRQLQYPPLTDMFVSCGYCQMRVEPSDPDSYARCFSCGVTVHTVCALRFRGPQPRRGSGINPLQCYPWLCVECKTCWICGSGLNEDHLISCNECDRGFHVYCLTAATSARQPTSLFTDDWVCEVCQPQNGCLRLSQ